MGAGGEGAGLICGTCRYWRRDDHPGVIEAHTKKVNRHGSFESTTRVLDDEPCGWCEYIAEHRKRYKLDYSPMLYFASNRACGVYEARRG